MDCKLFQTTDGVTVKLSVDCLWHEGPCSREAQGPRGLTGKAKDVQKDPWNFVATQALELLHQVERGEEAGPVCTQEQLRNRQRYLKTVGRENFKDCPAAALQEKFPGSIAWLEEHAETSILFITRVALLNLVVDGILISADGTYKSAPRQGHLITIGTTRYDSFIPVFVAITTKAVGSKGKAPESTDFFVLVFEAFAKAIKEHSKNPEWIPSVLLRDHAAAFIHACRIVFGKQVEDFVCWSHFTRCLFEFLEKFDFSEDVRKEVMNLAWALHKCEHEAEYQAGLALLERRPEIFYKHFHAWLSIGHHLGTSVHSKWSVSTATTQLSYYASAKIPVTRTQNGIENYHKEINASCRLVARGMHLDSFALSAVLCDRLRKIEAMFHVFAPGAELPQVFEAREGKLRSKNGEFARQSKEYMWVLQQHPCALGSSVQWWRNDQDEVEILTAAAVSRLRRDSTKSLDDWYKHLRVRTTSHDECSCWNFRKNPFRCCKHTIAFGKFNEQKDHLAGTPGASSNSGPSPCTADKLAGKPPLFPRRALGPVSSNQRLRSPNAVNASPPAKKRTVFDPNDTSTWNWHRSRERTSLNSRSRSPNLMSF